ncbi:MAG: tRNA dihydrouridine synthase DusB [Candidatus Rifleibacteriota bacterium]
MHQPPSVTEFDLPWLDSPAEEYSADLQNPSQDNPLKKYINPVKIGNVLLPNNLVLAPMAGVTDGPFRLLCSRLGVGYTISELASARAITMKNRQTVEMVRFQAQSRPYGVQIFGSDPAEMAKAAAIIEELKICDIIDINMGCPVSKVVKTGAGSALMNNPELAGRIVTSVKNAVSVPVSIKCRLGWCQNSINVKDFVKHMINSGAQAVTVHARTRQAGYSGNADWKHLEGLKDICGKIPFFANGDIETPEHIKELYERTGCDGFMIGRGCVGKPWIFSKLLGYNLFENKKNRFRIFRHHLIDMLMEYGPKAVPLFRVHLFGYLKNHPNASKARQILCDERDPLRIIKTGEAFFNNLPLPGIN